ncbi:MULTISPECIES: hypothetical protein [unclassified Mesorhizobium]|uniref:hypothetical protein n=1 Tax=unclassified Mesorhizobium TaxID=325217 RepID=UPI001CCD5C66|nr:MULTISPECIES: hypothetical protein [unclassified Mesorhizobium]MBZ9739177.1 hypothetical protein [Mesorhizobium sp. CO1-1-4]MBZ9802518.1 hypothetical protein [Mesorhizobium sp. ES1-6]
MTSAAKAAGQVALPPFFLQSARNFSRALPCSFWASASAEHCFEIAVFSGVIAVVFAFFAGAAVVAAGAVVVVVAAVVAAAAAPVAMNPATAMEVRTLAILIMVTPLSAPPGIDW